MNIAVFYELQSGGARRAANEFAQALKKLGHRVELFYVDPKHTGHEKPFYSAVHWHKFIPVSWKGKNWKNRLYRDTGELIALNALHKKIAGEINMGGFDFVFVQPSTYTQAPFILNHLTTPTLYYCQEPLRLVYDPVFSALPKDLDPVRTVYEWAVRKVRKYIDAYNIKNADVVLANSRFTKKNIQQAYGIKSTACHMGVDTTVFYPDGKKTIDLLFVGTRDTEEGFGMFQECLKYMKTKPKICYLIRGENWTSNDTQLRRLYSSAKIVLCFGYNEPFGLTPIEAMACGAIPVALNEGGYKDSVRQGVTGVLVNKQPKHIARILDSLLRSPSKLVHLSQLAVKDMHAQWTWESSAKQVMRIFRKRYL